MNDKEKLDLLLLALRVNTNTQEMYYDQDDEAHRASACRAKQEVAELLARIVSLCKD